MHGSNISSRYQDANILSEKKGNERADYLCVNVFSIVW
jgi:hypothetical protein